MYPDPAPAGADTRFFGHPRGLATLFFTEMWERFSYYGMRALLILYMTHKIAEGGLGFNDAKAGAIYGLYTAMVYLLCLAGGWMADRITGQRRAVLIGGILIAARRVLPGGARRTAVLCRPGAADDGHRAAEGQREHHRGPTLRAGRSAARFRFLHLLHGHQPGRADLRRIACGWVGENVGWRLGFGLAGVGMFAGLIQYVLRRSTWAMRACTGRRGSPENDRRQKRRRGLGGWRRLAVLRRAGRAGRDRRRCHYGRADLRRAGRGSCCWSRWWCFPG